MNGICDDQNSDWHLQQLAAQRALYGSVKKWFAVRALLSTVVSAALALGAFFYPAVKPYVVFLAFAVMGLDHVWLSSSLTRRQEQAALIQESFDCELFGLPRLPAEFGKKTTLSLQPLKTRWQTIAPSRDLAAVCCPTIE